MTSGARPTATASISCSDHSKGASCSRAVIRMASSRSGRPTGESQRAFTPVPAPRIAAAAAEGPPAGSGAGMASRLRDSGSTSAGSEVPVCAPALAGASSTARQRAAADIRMIGSLVDACIGSTPVSPWRKSPLHSSGEVPAVSTADATRHRPADAGARAFLVSASIQGRPAGARPGASDLSDRAPAFKQAAVPGQPRRSPAACRRRTAISVAAATAGAAPACDPVERPAAR